MMRWLPFSKAALTVGYFVNMRSKYGVVERANLSVAELAMNPRENLSASVYVIRHNPETSAEYLRLTGVADASNLTFGGTFDRAWNFESLRLDAKAELAAQRATASGSPLINARYYRVGIGAGIGEWMMRADHENRASNDGKYGFQTLLSDFYAYNGNALAFFATAKEGVRDNWVTLRWASGRWTVLNEYHWFKSDTFARSLGKELDLNLTYNWSERGYAKAQWASYRSGKGPQPDVDKLWLTVGYAIK